MQETSPSSNKLSMLLLGVIFFLIILFFMNFYNASARSYIIITCVIGALLFMGVLFSNPNPNSKSSTPNDMKTIQLLLDQTGNVFYVVLYTIFVILFYSLIPSSILDTYGTILNACIVFLGFLSFYKGLSYQIYMEHFNINAERIKYLVAFMCMIVCLISFYIFNPNGSESKWFGYSLVITIMLALSMFLYVLVLMLEASSSETSQSSSNLFPFAIPTMGLTLFLIVATVFILNDSSFLENKSKSISSIILLLFISILSACMIWLRLPTTSSSSSLLFTGFRKALIVLFGLMVSGLFIAWIVYNVENLTSSSSSITSFILNALLVIIILGIIYNTIKVELPNANHNVKKNALFSLILNTVLYIPCLISGVFNKMGSWFGSSSSSSSTSSSPNTTGSLLMLLVAVGLILGYFIVPLGLNYITTQGGNQLVNRPVYTDTLYNLGTYADLNGSDDFDYQYALSCWIFLDASNPNYNTYTSLMNFGEKPNILYNGKTNTLMITMQQKDLQKTTNNKLFQFDEHGNRILYVHKNMLLQKWNQLVINYNGGTLDIFLNGQLVKSSLEVVPYYSLDNLTIGENDGIKGGICNVIYFNKALSSNNIYYIYNTVKYKDPPVLNDSSETIVVKNINQTVSSATQVIT